MFCRDCKYPIRGLERSRCPECGRPFQPSDPSTFLARRDQGQPQYIIAAVFIAAIFVLPFLSGLIYWAIATGNHLLKQLFP